MGAANHIRVRKLLSLIAVALVAATAPAAGAGPSTGGLSSDNVE